MSDANFLEWLRETVAEAARTADQHEALKRLIRELRVSVEARFGLAAVQVGSRFVSREVWCGKQGLGQGQDRARLMFYPATMATMALSGACWLLQCLHATIFPCCASRFLSCSFGTSQRCELSR